MHHNLNPLQICREEHILKKVDQMVAEAKAKMAKGDKKGALFAMKRKKLYEQEADKIQNVKMTLETQVINLESASLNTDTYEAMKSGTTTMKNIRNQVGIEKVDEIMDDMKEEMEMAQEVNNAIAQPVDPLMCDEDELLAELEGLETADLEAELLKAPSKPMQEQEELSLPSVPAGKPTQKVSAEEEDDLKKLEAELAGL
jgi:charged multivesicular body protein 4